MENNENVSFRPHVQFFCFQNISLICFWLKKNYNEVLYSKVKYSHIGVAFSPVVISAANLHTPLLRHHSSWDRQKRLQECV